MKVDGGRQPTDSSAPTIPYLPEKEEPEQDPYHAIFVVAGRRATPV